jgi:uncharacterized protein YjiS (DUF1127 family)
MNNLNHLHSLHPAAWTSALFVRSIGAAGGSGRFLNVLLAWQERAQARHGLAEQDDRLLADMGIGRAEAVIEADKPFWQA